MLETVLTGVISGILWGVTIGLVGAIFAYLVFVPWVEKLAKLIKDGNVKRKVQELIVKLFYRD